MLRLVALALSTLLLAPAAGREPLPFATPDSQGLSAARLDRVQAAITGSVEAERHAGAVWLIARHGRIVDWQARGFRDLEARLPMERDTIFRIYSMSKVITTVAAMILVEEGRLRLEDEVGSLLPALASMQVWKSGTEARPVLVPAERPITVKQLLTHTSGLIYGFGEAPIDKVYQKANLYASPSMQAFVEAVARMPLAFQPGERYAYGFGIDVVGALVEKITGQPFEQFVRDRITGPLEMRDTGFDLPASAHSRIARIYTRDSDGALTVVEPFADVHPAPGRGFAAGGAGMFSTAADYARFGQMLLDGGELHGVRILGRKTVELMMLNHLAHLDQPTVEAGGGDGFGLGGLVRVNVANTNGLGSVGQFGWNGAACTFFRIDPVEDTLVLLLTQQAPYDEAEFDRFSTLFYASLVD